MAEARPASGFLTFLVFFFLTANVSKNTCVIESVWDNINQKFFMYYAHVGTKSKLPMTTWQLVTKRDRTRQNIKRLQGVGPVNNRLKRTVIKINGVSIRSVCNKDILLQTLCSGPNIRSTKIILVGSTDVNYRLCVNNALLTSAALW